MKKRRNPDDAVAISINGKPIYGDDYKCPVCDKTKRI